MARRLEILSASFTCFAASDVFGAWRTCSALRVSFGRVLSSETSATMPATSAPKAAPSTSSVVGSGSASLSSTVSCSRAAITASGGAAWVARIIATSSTWLT